MFDDQPHVIQEALEWALEGYPIKKRGARTTRAHPSGPLLMQWSSTEGQDTLKKVTKPWWPLKKGIAPEAQPNP